MIGELSREEIESLLHGQIVGRIGCCDKNTAYVIPISYAYDNGRVYCHSYEGKKMNMMRNNPEVCFQVDEMKDMGNWKSVVAWGEFKEITDPEERIAALKILLKRPLPIVSSITTHLGKLWPFTADGFNNVGDIAGSVFAIYLREKSGRFESGSVSP